MALWPALRPLLGALAAVLLLAVSAGGEQVVLLDSTKEMRLEWTRYPYNGVSISPGWTEESFNNFDMGISWRSYVVCDVAFDMVNNWLWTPFIERGDANRIYIETKFTIRDCSMFPGRAVSCRETFSLLYYEFDIATRDTPPWDLDSYKLIGRIAPGEGRSNTNNDININTEVKSIAVSKKGVYFAFKDEGGCLSILAVKVYYVTCPEVTLNFARFPVTPTGKEVTVVEKINGTCVENAEPVDAPTYVCKGDGKWGLAGGSCKCRAGFEPNFALWSCSQCAPGQFKPITGDDLCKPCPAHSSSTAFALSECPCDQGYFRARMDQRGAACTQPPSAPENLTAVMAEPFTVLLTWRPPARLGGRKEVLYRLKCDACDQNTNALLSEPSNETHFTISGLNPATVFHFRVFSENMVSEVSGAERQWAEVSVTTEAGGFVGKVRVVSVKSTELTVAWDAPAVDAGDRAPESLADKDIWEKYEVRWFSKRDGEGNYSSLGSLDLQITLTGLQQQTEYGIQVRAKSQHGWGEWSSVIVGRTGQVAGPAYIGDEDNMQVRVIAGAMVAVVVLLVIIIILTVSYLRSRADNECNKKQPGDCNTLDYRNGEVYTGLENVPIKTGSNVTTPLFTAAGASSRTYIDPHTYEDPNQAVKEFAREIDASCITIEAIIGGGEFGDVCRGKLKLPPSCIQQIDVAIKTLKPGSADKSRCDFLTEASIMGQFEHPNVIFLQGVVTKCNPVMIITEFMENGSLDTFLRANDGKFQVLQLVGMLRGIAAGMQYLSEMNYVHRDLAARNVLVNSQLVCKIADFGLSREIESTTEGAYTTRGGKIPVRWTAPEAIAFRKFTSASDVWSLGIVCWEVMSFGERPYWNWSNQDVIKSIDKGYRLPAPMDCPEAIYQLMLDCWQKERTHRPAFVSIVKTLDKLIRCPDTLRKIAQNRSANPLAGDTPDLTHFNCVEDWLNSIKMARYNEKFRAANITDMDSVVNLTVQQLTLLGITLVGHQKKIMNSVQTMRAQIRVNGPEGFLV